MTTTSLNLDVWQTKNVYVKANQGEVNSRFLEITLTDKSVPLNLTDKTVVFYTTKPDGNVIYNLCTIEDAASGVISVCLTSQMSAVEGKMPCEIHLIDNDRATLKAVGLELEIVKCADVDGAVESTSEFTALETAMAEYDEASDEINAHVANKNNPHEVTTMQIGAAESNHTHSTSDITSGTLSISRGGTSAATSNGALSNLGGVPKTRTINSKPLSSDITLNASDVGAVPTTRTINSKPLSINITLNASDVGAAESTHEHSTSDITSGTLPINRGGTGSTTASDALANLGGVKFSNIVQQKIYIPNQPEVAGNSFKIISLTNPFQGNTTDKILGITSYKISGRFEPDATGDRCIIYLNSPCPFDNTSALGSIMVYNSYGRSLYVTTDSYIVVTSIKP